MSPTRPRFPRHLPITAGCLAGIGVLAGAPVFAQEVQIGRYSLSTATPTVAQMDLLNTVLTLRMPEPVRTVGEAVRHLLYRSGYRLAPAAIHSPETTRLFSLPLPEVHRTLGPMSLRDALWVLAGPAFALVQDPVHRLIAFERCPIEPDGTPVCPASSRSGGCAG